MKLTKLQKQTSRRESRVFADEFNSQAVQLLHEQRAARVIVTQNGPNSM